MRCSGPLTAGFVWLGQASTLRQRPLNLSVRRTLRSIQMYRHFLLALSSLLIACSSDVSFEPIHEATDRQTGATVQIEAALPSPTGFSPHPVRAYLVLHGTRELIIEERLANDGANLGPDNFVVTFDDEAVLICFRGQEQASVLHTISPDRRTREEGGC